MNFQTEERCLLFSFSYVFIYILHINYLHYLEYLVYFIAFRVNFATTCINYSLLLQSKSNFCFLPNRNILNAINASPNINTSFRYIYLLTNKVKTQKQQSHLESNLVPSTRVPVQCMVSMSPLFDLTSHTSGTLITSIFNSSLSAQFTACSAKQEKAIIHNANIFALLKFTLTDGQRLPDFQYEALTAYAALLLRAFTHGTCHVVVEDVAAFCLFLSGRTR